jgi:hypothetical protein
VRKRGKTMSNLKTIAAGVPSIKIKEFHYGFPSPNLGNDLTFCIRKVIVRKLM